MDVPASTQSVNKSVSYDETLKVGADDAEAPPVNGVAGMHLAGDVNGTSNGSTCCASR
jgi:hypothetical protein